MLPEGGVGFPLNCKGDTGYLIDIEEFYPTHPGMLPASLEEQKDRFPGTPHR